MLFIDTKNIEEITKKHHKKFFRKKYIDLKYETKRQIQLFFAESAFNVLDQ